MLTRLRAEVMDFKMKDDTGLVRGKRQTVREAADEEED